MDAISGQIQEYSAFICQVLGEEHKKTSHDVLVPLNPLPFEKDEAGKISV